MSTGKGRKGICMSTRKGTERKGYASVLERQGKERDLHVHWKGKEREEICMSTIKGRKGKVNKGKGREGICIGTRKGRKWKVR